MSMSLFWLVVMLLFGVLEAVTVGLTSIWFGLGALGALAASAASAPVLAQIVVFLGVSFLTLLLVRPLAQRFINDRKVATNADRVIGREAVVTEDIDNIQGRGRVSVSGLLVRPLAQRFINDRKVATNADRVIGREAVVTEDIDNIQGRGRVSVSGADWTARTEDDHPISAGSTVRVLRIEGVKLIVAHAGEAGEPPQDRP